MGDQLSWDGRRQGPGPCSKALALFSYDSRRGLLGPSAPPPGRGLQRSKHGEALVLGYPVSHSLFCFTTGKTESQRVL